ncbi:MAG TPA: type I methionyl aminopeptidase [Planctomycetes bacterium]|nr:type I methionyl aminopeptidase [Planctomycetota bacterium]HIJ71018.1 type I methionyl aminopeptidase [Planctomycetota bacterium]
MAITLRSSREIELLRRAGAVVAEVLSKVRDAAKPGMSTGRLDELAAEVTARAGGTALFKGVESPYAKRPFPGIICASINEQVVHGIPSAGTRLKNGDILSIDYGVKLTGYCGDAALTFGIGRISPARQKLIDVTKQLLDIAIETSAPGVKWSRIAGRMEACAKRAGFSVVKDFVGHGIGRQMHEDPKIPNFVSEELMKNDIILREGMMLAVEPMVNMGTSSVRTLRDGWTVVTKDGKCSAHFEHTLAIVKSGCEVMTV